MIRILFLGSILLFCQAVFAQQYNQSIDINKISHSDTWLKLLVYDNDKSFIKSKGFFFAEDGATNPEAELLATLQAFADPGRTEDPNNHPQCKFAGRYIWLKSLLNLDAFGISEQKCPAFSQFTQQQNISSVSMIFATGFLGNPASYYGHLLVKLNSDHNGQNDLQSAAINFGADVPVDENMAIYVIKGITGGYDSAFTQQQYFLHAGNYGESELRDLWEYELDVAASDVHLLLGHIWELMDADYQYYFFNRNCAFHMAQLLELVVQNKLTQSSRLWVTPQSVMQNLAGVQFNNKPLIKSIKYHPSRQSRLYQRFAMLNEAQKQAVFALVYSPEKITPEHLSDFTVVQQHQIADTLIDYYQFMRKADQGEADANNALYKQALLLRYRLPAGVAVTTFGSDSRPHSGRKPSLTSVQYTAANGGYSFGQLQLRPAYYDALDAQQGHVRYSALSMGEIHLGFTNEKLFVKDLSLVRIDSIRANLTGLPGDKNYSWYLDIGATQAALGCKNCTVSKLSSGIGYAFESKLNFNVSGFVGMGYLGANINLDNAYLAARLASTWYVSDQIGLNLDAELRQFQSGEQRYIHKLAIRYSWETNAEMRFKVASDNSATEITLSYGWYW
ncbi:Lnb N-terminal periplasmic domain-containing protein [Arsukibacterium sp.]|uniref:Lnb N-terminal periplasmic domain-containing protein n=1 Tax=Arsukibacterium sp. TaxID=1977258 RepID=UPI002FDB7416